MPIAPDPAKRSRNRHPGTSAEIMLNRVSLMRSVVGLVLLPLTVFSGRLLAVPAITLNSVLLPDSKSPVQASAFHAKHHGLGSRDIGCYGDVVSVAFPGDLYDVRLVWTGHQRIIEIDDQIHIIALDHIDKLLLPANRT